MEENLIRMARSQAWARAKGELQAMLCAFFGESSASPGQFQELDDLVTQFVDTVERNGLAE